MEKMFSYTHQLREENHLKIVAKKVPANFTNEEIVENLTKRQYFSKRKKAQE